MISMKTNSATVATIDAAKKAGDEKLASHWPLCGSFRHQAGEVSKCLEDGRSYTENERFFRKLLHVRLPISFVNSISLQCIEEPRVMEAVTTAWLEALAAFRSQSTARLTCSASQLQLKPAINLRHTETS